MKTRRQLLHAALLTTLPGLGAAVHGATAKGKKRMLYIGTYAGANQPGIYRVDLDDATGELTPVSNASGVENPSFLALHPNRKFLYAACEVSGTGGGQVAAFSIHEKTGALTLLNQESSKGDGPCHVAVDQSGKCVVVANYGSGSVACLPILGNGHVGPSVSSDQHTGSSVNAGRQEGPHAHSMTIDPTNKFVIAADLGTDKLYVYKLDPAKATLTPNDPPFTATKPGAGPRHFAFHPDGKRAYAINELDSTVAVYDWDGDKGTLTARQTISTLPAGFTGQSSTAEVKVHPSGKFLYGSNRGHDSIAEFAIDANTGELTLIGHTPTGGKTPRNFNLTADGTFLIAANQDSGNVVSFRVDKATGKLIPAGQPISIPKPVCIRFL